MTAFQCLQWEENVTVRAAGVGGFYLLQGHYSIPHVVVYKVDPEFGSTHPPPLPCSPQPGMPLFQPSSEKRPCTPLLVVVRPPTLSPFPFKSDTDGVPSGIPTSALLRSPGTGPSPSSSPSSLGPPYSQLCSFAHFTFFSYIIYFARSIFFYLTIRIAVCL